MVVRRNVKIFGIIILIFFLLVGGYFIMTNKNKDNNLEKEYSKWKSKYVVSVKENVNRVVNPQDNNITVSEGIAYGLLFSASMNDKETFDKLYNYAKLYFDEKGLMHWKIDASGNVIGKGSATDADEDMAYALLCGYKVWKEEVYLDEAKKLIDAIGKYEINSDYMVLPGDSWSEGVIFNPSYIAPLYYQEFASVSNSEFWNQVLSKNLSFLNRIMNKETGLLPDWINYDGKIIPKDNKFGYDAVRVPIRLLQFYKKTQNEGAMRILNTEYNFISKIGASNLVAGYTVEGSPLESYINPTYLSSFYAISMVDEKSGFSKEILKKLNENTQEEYYGDSLKLWILLVSSNKLAY